MVFQMKRGPLRSKRSNEKLQRREVSSSIVSSGTARHPEKEEEARVLSRAAERTERELTENLETDLTLKGWSISTLIHDEIIIQRPVDEKIHHDSVDALSRDAKLALRNFENTKGWAPGTLDVNVFSY